MIRCPFLVLVGLGTPLMCTPVVVGAVSASEEAPSRHSSDAVSLDAARAFLATLDAEARDRASAPINAPDRGRWSYLPEKRIGVRLEELDQAQRAAWRAFLATTLSESGLRRVDRIRGTEPVQDRGGGVFTGPEVFAIRFHGLDGDAAAPVGAWAWRIEGHHLHLGETLVNGRVVASTPFMLGSVRRLDAEGEVFECEEAAAARLLAGVPEAAREIAWREGPVPGDMLTAMRPSDAWRLDGGIPLDRAGEAARAIADGIVEGLLSLRREDAVAELRARWRALPDDEIRFLWIGDADRARTHQWRLVSPVLVVEFSHSGGDANHGHLAMRTIDGEFSLAEAAWKVSP